MFVKAQSVSESPAKLKTIFEKYHQLNIDIPKDRVYYVDYSVNARLRSEDNQATDQRIQSWMTSNKQVVKNDYVEMFSTSEYTASIMLSDKRVNITPLPKGYAQQAKSQLAFSLIDRLFEKYRVISCEPTNGKFYKIILIPGKGGLDDFNVKKAELIIDWDKAELKGFTTIMGEVGQIESMTMVINRLDFDYQESTPLVDFVRKYISSDGNLIGKYKGFSLIDNRIDKS